MYDDSYNLTHLIELNWNQFVKYKRWHSRMTAWNLPVNKEVMMNGKIIFEKFRD